MNSGRVSFRLRFIFCLILGLVVISSVAFAQEFVFTKVVDTNDPVPNGAGTLFATLDAQPAFDGGTVIFRNGPGSLAPNAIWAASGDSLTELVDLNTSVPGGAGVFSALILDFSAPGYPVLSNGTVVFAGRDSASSGYTGGLYSVPAAGGAITRIANRNVVAPGGGNFDGGLQYFSVDSGKVAFNGTSSGGSITGIYSANTNGAAVTVLADSMHPAHPEFVFPIGNFNFPSISGTTVAFYGNGVFDPSTGYNALYTSGTAGGYVYGEPATSEEPLPGDPTGVFHTRFGRPQLDGSTIFFRADDANTNPNFNGLFSVSKSGGAITNIVDVNDTLPGLTSISTNNSFTSYSAAAGTLAFTATDGADHYGLYSHTGSTTTKVLATGDAGPFSDLHATIYIPSIGNQAVADGNIAIMTGVRFSASGIYLATPMSASADLEPTLTVTPANTSVGADADLNLVVVNNGPAAATTNSFVVTLPPGLDFKSAAGGTFDAASRTVSFSLTSLLSGATKSYAIVATVNAAGPLTASAYANSLTPDSDRLNNHAFATTNSIFASTGNWVVRKIVDNLTPVPDRDGETFGIGGGLDPLPALDGGKVAFISFAPGNLPVIWSANADGSGGFTRLVDTTTSLPGGAGAKFGYLKTLRLRNASVSFLGFGDDSAHDGFYSLPVTGGAVKKIVASGDIRPEGTGTSFGYQDFIQNFYDGYVGDGQKTFAAQSGLYVYPVAGGGPGTVVVYPGSNIPTAGNAGVVFSVAPAISGNRVVWEATGSGDAVLESHLDERRYAALADIATESPSTPGENFVLSNQFSFANVQVEGNTVVFRAYSGANASIQGIYSVTDHGPAVKLVDTNTSVPGGKGKFTGFTTAGSPDTFALSDGEVVFLGTDEDSRAGLYSISGGGGAITRIVAVGDTVGNYLLTGTTGFSQPPFQPNSLGAHQVAFRADFLDTTTNTGSVGIFVAGRVDNRLANISTRLTVGSDDSALIGGLIISGSAQKTVLIRGLGPSLAEQNVPNALADPTLELHDGSGAVVASNDNWKESQKKAIEDTGIPPTNDLESAIVATVDPGSYTAVLRGKNNTTGNGLVEVYDLASATELDTRLVNISTRGFVQTGDNVMIGGIIIQGAVEKHLIVRALGPSLANQEVPSPLSDPTLDVADGSGNIIASNDNWRDSQEDLIIASTIPPSDDLESAIDLHLIPGNYTAIVRGEDNATGNALVEFYELP